MGTLLNTVVLGESQNVLDDKPTQITEYTPEVNVETAEPYRPIPKTGGSLLRAVAEGKEEEYSAKVNNSIIKNPAVREAAIRFVRDRLGQTNLSEDEAIDEYIEHFREFNVNEITAGGDYNYVSAAANDATGGTNLDKDARERASQRLSDYRLLYQTFNEMPAFSDGFWKATGDYTEGLLKAPSTYVGLLLPGIGKGSGVAATQAAKIGVQRTLMQALKTPLSTVANKAIANPMRTTMFVEGVGTSLQNVAQQKTEMELDLRDDYSYSETGLVFGIGAAAPVAVAPGAIKGLLTGAIEESTGELSEEALKAVAKKNEIATKEADKIIEENIVLAEEVSNALRPLNPEKVSAGREKFADIAEEKGIAQVGDKEGLARTLGAAVEDIAVTSDFVLSLDKTRTKRIFASSVEILAKSDEGLLEGERITEAVARVISGMNSRKAKSGDKFYKDILDKYNLTNDDFANMFMADVSDAARLLQQAGASKKIFQRLNAVAADSIFALDDTAKESVEKLGKALEDGDVRKITESSKQLVEVQKQGYLRSLDTLRLAAMTSQTATTVRNTVSGYTRVGFDILTRGLDKGIDAAVSKVTGRQVRQAPNEDIFAVAYGLVNKREAMAIEEIFKLGFHNKASQLFRELQDIPADSAIGGRTMRMRGLARELNALNTMSDNMFKRAAFVSSLKRQLNELYTAQIRAGKSVNASDYNLRTIMREGKFNSVFGTDEGKIALDKAVKDALYFTYQKSPDSPAARAFIQGIHKYPFLTTSLVPFPRFVANAMRFTYEYSPLYIMEGAKRSLFKDANNYEEISKALVGTGMLAGAMAFRNSEYAGENWWEGKTASGDTYDLRPFFPAAPYLFVADLLNRSLKGDPVMGDRSFITDSIQALTGTQFRAGFGIYAIDSALNDVFRDDIDAYQKAGTIGANFGANIISTFTIPLTLGQDMYNTFLAPDDERIVRETKTSDVWDLIINKSLARIPGNYAIENYLADSLGVTSAREIYEVPTREEPLRRKTPILRQVSGILLNERKNFLEKELARLKISNRILSQKTGVPEADTLINALIGEYATDYLVPKLQNSKKYKEMTSAEQKDFIRQLIQNYKGDIMELVKYRSRRSGKDRYGFDPMERVAFNRFTPGVQERALSEYHQKFGKPQGDDFYDYERLVDIAEKVRKRGF